MEYKLIRSSLSDEIVHINKTVENEDGETITMSIPLDEDNRDYQEYLEWIAEGKTPEETE
ncbi:hypothetical protein Venkman_gp52 [Methylophilales phage Venkman EXVC282S]|nr:hypothetical protein Venkman_gp52 [Methylophilales phage Venkman EXVC282S]